MTASFAEIDWRGRKLRIEYQWLNPHLATRPLLVFLHEGLGSVSMWRGFPQAQCDAAQVRGLVFSRPGYGRSTPRAEDEHWAADFMHRQAHEVLPALFAALQVSAPPFLLGHSDGGSIALLYAARFPGSVAGLIAMAPHIRVEDVSISSIRATRAAFLGSDLPERLARHHEDVESAFWGWNDIWLAPDFGDWSIEAELSRIRCPVLAIQGTDDEYGTLEQVRGIARRVPGTRLLELADCGHSPHRDQPAAVLAAVRDFIDHGSPPPSLADAR